LVFKPPRIFPIACFPFFLTLLPRQNALSPNLNPGKDGYPLVPYLSRLKGVKNPFQHAVFGLAVAVDSDGDGMPGAEGIRESPPFAAIFADIDERVKEADCATLNLTIGERLRHVKI
jgi:hypothetical protein